jgi:hypothetical protein
MKLRLGFSMKLRLLRIRYSAPEMAAHPSHIEAGDASCDGKIYVLQAHDGQDWRDVPVVSAEEDRLNREIAGL